jgi:hypothetical protein
MRNRRQRDREMTEDELREHLARIEAEEAARKAAQEKERIRMVLAEWMD